MCFQQLVHSTACVAACTLIPSHRLPEKVAADRDGLLVAFAHSEIGVLNNVVELWRYPSAAACLRCDAWQFRVVLKKAKKKEKE
jgi:hypothetical protein